MTTSGNGHCSLPGTARPLDRYRIPPRLLLATLPTPVRRLRSLGTRLGIDLWLKDDGASGSLYGGNKVRKLEFLLAPPSRQARPLVVYGPTGSHWVLATCLYARQLGLETEAFLFPVPATPHQQETYRRIREEAGRVREVGSIFSLPGALAWRLARRGDPPPCLLPIGGSSPLSSLGYVEAALELAGQIEAGLLPRPDVVVVPLGSTGTAAGLAAGFALARAKVRVLGVQVAEAPLCTLALARILADRALSLLRRGGASLPGRVRPAGLEVVRGFLGPGYAQATPEGDAAARLFAGEEGLALDPTYTAKAGAALAALARSSRLSGLRVLFWMTLARAQEPAQSSAGDLSSLSVSRT